PSTPAANAQPQATQPSSTTATSTATGASSSTTTAGPSTPVAVPTASPTITTYTQAAPALRAVPVISVPSSIREGQLVRISGQGFKPGSHVKVVFYVSTPKDRTGTSVVATAKAGPQGQFVASAPVPLARPGNHELRVTGVSASGKVTSVATRVVVLSTTAAIPNRSQRAMLALLAIAVALPIATWVSLGLFSRWRRARPGQLPRA
ncbi:MAG: hypothetical protein ACP5VR_12420, partial [Acidimicrobiales bacterium]